MTMPAPRIHLVNPSTKSFGVAVITPRWLYVLAGATGHQWGDPNIVDETLDPIDITQIAKGDVVGIGIHTGNARRGYEVGRECRERGAWVVYGGIHATLFPDEVLRTRRAHMRSSGATATWCGPKVVADCLAGQPQQRYEGGRIAGEAFVSARWDLLPEKSYMWASVQTVRGCPKHCSFCSVWRTDGQEPRLRSVERVVREVVELRRKGFRFIALADDNFYPVSHQDIAQAKRRADPTRLHELEALRDERFQLMEALSELPSDLVFYTQITMEAAEDTEFLDAMKKARILGALVGVESVTEEGLKDVYKGFNLAGDELVERLKTFRRHGIHILGSFIFGLPSDRADTFDATVALAKKADLAFAQFVLLTPFPGTVDFEKWAENERQTNDTKIDGVSLTTHWLIPEDRRPTSVYRASHDEPRTDSRRHPGVPGTSSTAGRKCGRGRASSRSLRSRVAFMLISKLYRQMYANTGIATDSARVQRSTKWARLMGTAARGLFMAQADARPGDAGRARETGGDERPGHSPAPDVETPATPLQPTRPDCGPRQRRPLTPQVATAARGDVCGHVGGSSPVHLWTAASGVLCNAALSLAASTPCPP